MVFGSRCIPWCVVHEGKFSKCSRVIICEHLKNGRCYLTIGNTNANVFIIRDDFALVTFEQSYVIIYIE